MKCKNRLGWQGRGPRLFWQAAWGIGCISVAVGCRPTSVNLADGATRQQLTLLMPAEVNIVGPFTRFCSLSSGKQLDGIDLLLQPINTFGDPVNISGHLIAELYEFRQASGDCKGAELQQWDISLTTEREQRKYWNRTTSMYEFRLHLDRSALGRPHQKYVLEVTYNTPLKEHMVDEYVMEVPLSAEALAGAPG